MYTFSNYTKQLKSYMSVQYELTSSRWGHTQTRVGGGGARCVGGGRRGGASTHISTELSESEEGGRTVWQRVELPTSCIHEGGGAVRRQLELSPCGAREEERCHSRENQTSRSGLGPTSSRALSAC
jgi:hypothetical protein